MAKNRWEKLPEETTGGSKKATTLPSRFLGRKRRKDFSPTH
jgi:hypothetical protein